MAITRQIKDQLILDLQDVPNLFVRENPRDEQNVHDLEVELRTGGAQRGLAQGIDEALTMCSAINVTEQTFLLKLYRRTDDPDNDVIDTLDEIRRVVGREGSNLLATPPSGRISRPVEWALVTEWDDVLRTSDDAKADWGIIERIVVTVRYSYDQNVV